MIEKRDILSTIATNLRHLLTQAQLSSSDLAKRSGISPGSISKIMKGTMSITIPMAMNLAQGLDVDLTDLLSGLTEKNTKHKEKKAKLSASSDKPLAIGIVSINNRRFTCIKEHNGQIIGQSELEGGLDLAETTSSLMQLIQEAIKFALPEGENRESELKHATLNLVTQSYEFEDTRAKFSHFAERHFKHVLLLSDWQLTYLSAFKPEPGISLIADKGVSFSFMHHEKLKKLGGWKFPVYDLGGENWLGVETIRHTIEATEGYIPMSNLAHNVLAKFNGKIEKITEACFKRTDHDVYCLFAEPLLRSYFTGDDAAKAILVKGFKKIYRSVEKIDELIGKQTNIVLNGSLADIYKPFFDESRLITSTNEAEKAALLADLTKERLLEYGINPTL
ncbi:MAG: XRE family transcriptional regulator [Legionellales bacterium]|nr:XRE family transcriptional regulator [Legionellales bacterium]